LHGKLAGFTVTLKTWWGHQMRTQSRFLIASLFCLWVTLDASRAQAGYDIVFVPGIMGSSICDTNNGDELWLRYNHNLLFNDLARLKFSSNDSNDEPAEPTKSCGILKKVTVIPILFVEYAYESLLEFLDKEARLQAGRLIEFDYDWRAGSAVNALALAAKIPADHDYILVAHSLGGLIARAYMATLNAHLPKAYIEMGVPKLGAAAIINRSLWGYPNTPGLGADRVRPVGVTLPSVFDMLPRYADGCALQSGQRCDFLDLLVGNFGALPKPKPEIARRWRENAIKLRAAIDTGVRVPMLLVYSKSYERTAYQMKVSASIPPAKDGYPSTGVVSGEKPGDGAVPLPSVQAPDTDGNRCEVSSNEEHGRLWKGKTARQAMTDVIRTGTIPPQYCVKSPERTDGEPRIATEIEPRYVTEGQGYRLTVTLYNVGPSAKPPTVTLSSIDEIGLDQKRSDIRLEDSDPPIGKPLPLTLDKRVGGAQPSATYRFDAIAPKVNRGDLKAAGIPPGDLAVIVPVTFESQELSLAVHTGYAIVIRE
jgi:pimeloyl-ACP methyl ester carboxylesterase